MMGAMSTLAEALDGHTVVIELPRGGVTDWVAVAEVLLQEGLTAWAVPTDQFDLLAEMLPLYARRARIGVSGVVTPQEVHRAADAGAAFALSPILDAALADAAAGRIPLLMGALSPTEVARAAAAGEGAVVVAPADAVGTSYARALPPMFPGLDVVAWGRLERYQCEMWLDAGAQAVVVSEVVVRPDDGFGSNDLDEVARRGGPFSQLKATGR